ncbi:MAG: sugar transferase [Ignavibacteriaceae bacterium]|nr:sugar transferase [Ignavibacteriaceae bacterium]
MLIVSFPVLLICMIAIKLESKGSALYFQTRTGYKGNNFKLVKLRVMVENADKIGPVLTQENDPRVTKVGKFLRRISIDEMPQTINVLKGEMSIIGPRPEVTSITAGYTPEQKKIFNFKPGLTGIAQVNGRQLIPYEEKLKMEIEYYEKANFWSDIKILLKTPLVVITNKGNL